MVLLTPQKKAFLLEYCSVTCEAFSRVKRKRGAIQVSAHLERGGDAVMGSRPLQGGTGQLSSAVTVFSSARREHPQHLS